MRQFSAIERRLQDLERAFQNQSRLGEIVEVKFDKDKKRWFVKLNDGEDLTPSGQDSEHASKADTFKSDWLPWKSFSHGTIRMSVPPRKGMKAAMSSPGGVPELAVAEPFHYGPDAPSPHDKEDEVVMSVLDDEGEEKLRFHHSKDATTVTIGGTTWKLDANSATLTTDTINLDTNSFNVKAGSIRFTKK